MRGHLMRVWNKLIVQLSNGVWCDKELEIYSLMNLENDFFYFYFSNRDFLFTIKSSCTKLFFIDKKTFICREACLRILI